MERRKEDRLMSDKEKIKKLLSALKHAEFRLNSIPHNYDDTDFRMIRDALALEEPCE